MCLCLINEKDTLSGASGLAAGAGFRLSVLLFLFHSSPLETYVSVEYYYRVQLLLLASFKGLIC